MPSRRLTAFTLSSSSLRGQLQGIWLDRHVSYSADWPVTYHSPLFRCGGSSLYSGARFWLLVQAFTFVRGLGLSYLLMVLGRFLDAGSSPMPFPYHYAGGYTGDPYSHVGAVMAFCVYPISQDGAFTAK